MGGGSEESADSSNLRLNSEEGAQQGGRKGLFKKGSKAARDFMAMLRAKRGKTYRR
jgi:hypothetical protein